MHKRVNNHSDSKNTNFKISERDEKFNFRMVAIPVLLLGLLLLASCGLINSKNSSKQIDPPEDISLINENELELLDENVDVTTDDIDPVGDSMAKIELYLLDKNNFVVPQTVTLPNEEGVAKMALQSLVKNGPYSDSIPSGFQPVLPADTEVLGINVKDGIATVDFSKEFAEYKQADEEKIMQSVTWTLTQFETIDKVKLQINGYDLAEMPVNNAQIGDGLTRKIGINVDTSNIVDVTNTKPLTVYYIGQDGERYYYVPVTKRINNNVDDNIMAAINHLVDGPSYGSSLLTDFLPDVALLEEPKVVDGKVTLNFNESLVNSVTDEFVISEQMLTSLVLSLTEQPGIESVSVLIDGNDQLVISNGEKLSEPVTRPTKVNMYDF